MNVIIADDHELYREALSLLIQQQFDVDLCELVSSFDELNAKAKTSTEWSVFLVDLHMPGLNYVAGIQLLRQQFPTVPIIVITSSSDPEDTQNAIQAGALGYILKSMRNEELAQALELIINHGISIHPVVKPSKETTSQLTPRQHEVLKRMSGGASNKRIALDMGLSESTVKIHVRAILNALDVTNRTEAVIKAKSLNQ